MAVEYDQGGMLKLKLRDPVRYLELLARNRGLLRDKVALTDASGGAANDLINRRLMWQLPIIRWQGSAKKIMDYAKIDFARCVSSAGRAHFNGRRAKLPPAAR